MKDRNKLKWALSLIKTIFQSEIRPKNFFSSINTIRFRLAEHGENCSLSRLKIIRRLVKDIPAAMKPF